MGFEARQSRSLGSETGQRRFRRPEGSWHFMSDLFPLFPSREIFRLRILEPVLSRLSLQYHSSNRLRIMNVSQDLEAYAAKQCVLSHHLERYKPTVPKHRRSPGPSRPYRSRPRPTGSVRYHPYPPRRVLVCFFFSSHPTVHVTSLPFPCRTNLNPHLLVLALTSTSSLLTSLFALPTSPSALGPSVSLPPPDTILPREKPLPKPKPETKWERFAKVKGITHKKREMEVFDEEKQEWVGRWGKGGKSREAEGQWIHEIKPGDGTPLPHAICEGLGSRLMSGWDRCGSGSVDYGADGTQVSSDEECEASSCQRLACHLQVHRRSNLDQERP